VAEGEEPREREKERAKERGDEERERESLATGRSKAQRREMHHLCSALAALRAHHRVRVQQSKRGRERKGGREREREREGERENEKEGDTEKGEERKVPTDAEGRPTYIRRPIPTGRGGQEDERRAKPSRVGLGQVYPSATHTALLLRVPSRRGEPHEGGGATPS